jgi:hypothetical protein
VGPRADFLIQYLSAIVNLAGKRMSMVRPAVAVALWTLVRVLPAAAQHTSVSQDSSESQIRAVLRAFYLNLENRNWDALSAYVLSPKLLERRGGPGDLQMVARDRTRTRASSQPVAAPASCTSSDRPAVAEAAMRLDGDWAEVSVPRCLGTTAGTDEFRLLYFEGRWRFIYTDLFEPPANISRTR